MSVKVEIQGKIQLPNLDIEKDLRKIALNTIAVISERVQNKGKKTDNTRIRTKAEKKTGAYSKYYGKKRKKEGYQTSIIDLTVTGDLISRGLTAAPLSKNEWVVGFNDKQGVKADGLEDYFGTIFQLSDNEIQLVTKI
jgi:hypothetical protein